ncbi:MAG: shikimate dehydrogenase [Thermodesulfobacterium sp.]|nr:shikimate dehydrogenase [Thermodesulfobacterium sp.]
MYKVYGIIGYPVSHSLSPVMHNLAFRELGVKAVYGAFPVKPEDLSHAVRGIKALGISGLSVTIPHKIEVMKHLDEVDEKAKEIGAVNTILNREGSLFGTNTDWIGVLKAFEEVGVSLCGKRVVILGAGGASLAIIYAMVNAGAKEIIIYNRTFDKAKEVAERFSVLAYPWEDVYDAYGDILINATSVGLKSFDSPVAKEVVSRFSVVMDSVYMPLETKLLAMAKEENKIAIDGLKMLLYQGVEQFKLWTGLMPPVDKMREALYREVLRMEVEFGLRKGDKTS